MTFGASILFAALQISFVGETPSRTEGVGLSGLAWRGGDQYYAVNDRGGELYAMTIAIDRRTGYVTSCELGPKVVLAGRKDLESVVWDAARGCVWASDEGDGSVCAFDPVTGTHLCDLHLPEVYTAVRSNFAIEALALRASGHELWMCNEEALSRTAAISRHGAPVEDGPRATAAHGSHVRLQRFVRETPAADWRPNGQWAYEVDPLGGRVDIFNKARSGVSELCALPDGTLLVLEREFSLKKLCPLFRCRIYQVDWSAATDVSNLPSLVDETAYQKVRKTLVFERLTGFTMYESLCPGPTLDDGSQVLVLVADAGEGSAANIMTLKVRHMDD